VKNDRSADAMRAALDGVRRSAEAAKNIMPSLIEAARARASVGETMHALADVFGRCDATVV
jgi:methylmalonyl-CoA mutase N-terminal domain/subunit